MSDFAYNRFYSYAVAGGSYDKFGRCRNNNIIFPLIIKIPFRYLMYWKFKAPSEIEGALLHF